MPGASAWLKRWWPWIVFPLVAVAGNAIVFRAIGEEEPLTTTIKVGPGPQDVAVGEKSIWVSGFGDVGVSAFDPDSGDKVHGPLTVEGTAGPMTYVGGNMWIGSISGSELTPIDESTGDLGSAVDVGQTPQAVASDPEHVWAAAYDTGRISSVDPATGDALDHFRTGSRFPAAIATGFGSLWVADNVDDILVEVDLEDPTDTRTARIGTSPEAVATGEGAVWVAHFGDGTLYKVDPQTLEIELRKPLVIGGGLTDVAVGLGYVWVTSSDEDVLVQIDPKTVEEVRRIKVGDNPQGVAVGFDAVWVANQDSASLSKIEL